MNFVLRYDNCQREFYRVWNRLLYGCGGNVTELHGIHRNPAVVEVNVLGFPLGWKQVPLAAVKWSVGLLRELALFWFVWFTTDSKMRITVRLYLVLGFRAELLFISGQCEQTRWLHRVTRHVNFHLCSFVLRLTGICHTHSSVSRHNLYKFYYNSSILWFSQSISQLQICIAPFVNNE